MSLPLVQRRNLVVLAAAVPVIGGGLAMFREMRKPAISLPWVIQSVDGLTYAVLPPAHYDPAQAYPAVLYLHQYGMGSDQENLLREIQPWFGAPEFRARHPAIVVVPMLNQKTDPGANFGGKRSGRNWQEAVIAALGQVSSHYHLDPDRIYVTGNSMGGMGVWDMLLNYNAVTGVKGRIFAAGLPLAGRHQVADPEAGSRMLRDVPIWAIHGGQDPEVSPEWDRTMARLLKDRPNFRYTEVPDLGHDVWDRYYANAAVWDWLFEQRVPDEPG